MPQLYIIAGCNGAGKTTASFTVLPEMLNCKEFVNADEIARGLSPFNQVAVSFEAGRIMLSRIKELIKSGVDFAFETTLSTRSYKPIIDTAVSNGFKVYIIFFWLESMELAKARVRTRVLQGGHDIPPSVIERRYLRGLKNFFTHYKRSINGWFFYDNSSESPKLVAFGEKDEQITINEDIWRLLINTYDV